MAVDLYLQPLLALQRLVASSPTFQQLVAEPDAASTLKHIYFQESDDTLDPAAPEDMPNYVYSMPRAIIVLQPGTSRTRTGPGNWRCENQLGLAFQFIVPKELRGNNGDEAQWFLGLLNSIMADITNNSGLFDANNNPYLNANRFTIVDGPMPCDQDFSPMYFWGVDFRVDTPN